MGNIVVTGAAGFIGSCLVGFLNQKGYDQLIIVDDFSREDKKPNWENKKFQHKVERAVFFEWLQENNPPVDMIFHLGARTDTTEFDYSIHQELNVEYSQKIWNYCAKNNIPLVYASSAATYGAGELGYKDDHELSASLKPLNPYGISKNEFDKWALHQTDAPPFWAGLKFFNVYGPNESHKGRMASVIFHAVNQIRKEGKVKLFRSHRPDFKDGQQLRDFIYVKDLLKVCYWLMEQLPEHKASSGIYNIDMPEDIRDKYQYFTEADMSKLLNAGYDQGFSDLESGVDDYVRNYLAVGKYY